MNEEGAEPCDLRFGGGQLLRNLGFHLLGISPAGLRVAQFAVERPTCLDRSQQQRRRMAAWKRGRL
jgi:hypothetical protein